MGARVGAARKAALAALGDIRRRSGRARDVMRTSPRLSGLEGRDVALAERLVLGVTATSGQLDGFINSHAKRPSSLQPQVRDALRLSTFELCRLSTEPAVAVSQGVELVRSVVPRAAGLANAVLHRVAEEDAPRVRAAVEALSATSTNDPLGLALVSGWPTWLAEGVLFALGGEAARAMALSTLEPAPIWVSGNVALHDRAATREILASKGLKPIESPLPGCWRLASAAGLATSGLISSADVVTSDLAARLVARIASPAPGSSVLEVGQGRATKTLLLEEVACDAGRPARVVGIDSVASKRAIANERLAHGWGEWCRSLTFDARNLSSACLPAELNQTFDLVFVDAPCSGTGTMRRHPEIAWSLAPESVGSLPKGELPALQLAILGAAATRVAPGGALVYSTCSILPSEDEEVVRAFLESPEGSGFSVQDVREAPGVLALSASARAVVASNVDDCGFFRTHPVQGGPDGHFCARLVRNSEVSQ
ncbi:MAG: RsmB/NOP family class I SAM-dependent RNA methyltransferase [Tractidigestivibacter sp.]|uniref:RsmB/NOP family class I SAM-dependent RNA methyltransferase n=1 Tax=Tractidigestivibacter sp. TaxID=2847320 RepID=UPI003D8C32A4